MWPGRTTSLISYGYALRSHTLTVIFDDLAKYKLVSVAACSPNTPVNAFLGAVIVSSLFFEDTKLAPAGRNICILALFSAPKTLTSGIYVPHCPIIRFELTEPLNRASGSDKKPCPRNETKIQPCSNLWARRNSPHRRRKSLWRYRPVLWGDTAAVDGKHGRLRNSFTQHYMQGMVTPCVAMIYILCFETWSRRLRQRLY